VLKSHDHCHIDVKSNTLLIQAITSASHNFLCTILLFGTQKSILETFLFGKQLSFLLRKILSEKFLMGGKEIDEVKEVIAFNPLGIFIFVLIAFKLFYAEFSI